MARRKAKARSRAAKQPDVAPQAVLFVICLAGAYLCLYHQQLVTAWIRNLAVAFTPQLPPPHSTR